MQSSRAMDGKQDGTYSGIKVSWSYHPSIGLPRTPPRLSDHLRHGELRVDAEQLWRFIVANTTAGAAKG